MYNGTIKIAIVDDHQITREGTRALLENKPGIAVVLEASNGKELLDQLLDVHVDIVLLDIDMPVMNGYETIGRIRKLFPKLKVIVFSLHKSKSYIVKAIKLGVNGYVLKEYGSTELYRQIHKVMLEGHYLDDRTSKIVQKFLANAQHEENAKLGVPLSKREQEVLILICREYTAKEIAEKLGISFRTVEGHRKQLLAKTGAKKSVGLAIYAIEHGLINIHVPRQDL